MTLRVAIVEDSADLLDELLAFLRHRGFDAWGVRSAGSLLAAAASRSG